jgi:hypothetical protein
MVRPSAVGFVTRRLRTRPIEGAVPAPLDVVPTTLGDTVKTKAGGEMSGKSDHRGDRRLSTWPERRCAHDLCDVVSECVDGAGA